MNLVQNRSASSPLCSDKKIEQATGSLPEPQAFIDFDTFVSGKFSESKEFRFAFGFTEVSLGFLDQREIARFFSISKRMKAWPDCLRKASKSFPSKSLNQYLLLSGVKCDAKLPIESTKNYRIAQWLKDKNLATEEQLEKLQQRPECFQAMLNLYEVLTPAYVEKIMQLFNRLANTFQGTQIHKLIQLKNFSKASLEFLTLPYCLMMQILYNDEAFALVESKHLTIQELKEAVLQNESGMAVLFSSRGVKLFETNEKAELFKRSAKTLLVSLGYASEVRLEGESFLEEGLVHHFQTNYDISADIDNITLLLICYGVLRAHQIYQKNPAAFKLINTHASELQDSLTKFIKRFEDPHLEEYVLKALDKNPIKKPKKKKFKKKKKLKE